MIYSYMFVFGLVIWALPNLLYNMLSFWKKFKSWEAKNQKTFIMYVMYIPYEIIMCAMFLAWVGPAIFEKTFNTDIVYLSMFGVISYSFMYLFELLYRQGDMNKPLTIHHFTAIAIAAIGMAVSPYSDQVVHHQYQFYTFAILLMYIWTDWLMHVALLARRLEFPLQIQSWLNFFSFTTTPIVRIALNGVLAYLNYDYLGNMAILKDAPTGVWIWAISHIVGASILFCTQFYASVIFYRLWLGTRKKLTMRRAPAA